MVVVIVFRVADLCEFGMEVFVFFGVIIIIGDICWDYAWIYMNHYFIISLF